MVLGSIRLTTDNGTVLFDNPNFRTRGEASFEYDGSVTSVQSSMLENYILNLFSDYNAQNLVVQYIIPESESLNFQIANIQGQVLYSENRLGIAGTNNWNYSTQDLHSGIYILTMQNQSGKISKKFVIP